MRITDIVDFNPTTSLEKGEQFPFIKMADLPISGRDIIRYEFKVAGGSGSKFKNGDTLFARITPCLENGKGGLVMNLPSKGKGHGSTEFIVMRARCPTDQKFVYYLSRLPEFRRFAIQQMSGTSGRQRVNWQALFDFEVSKLDWKYRENIGLILGMLDDKIEVNRRTNETLEAMARAIFKDWFVDFGPTRAKAEGRAPYLAPELWELFPDTLDDSDKPSGWRNGKLNDLIVLQRGFDLPKPKRVKGEFPILAASGVNGTHNEAKVPGPGVTTGRSGVIGKTFYVHEDFWPLNTSLWVKQYRNSSPAHAYFLIQTLDFVSFNSGSAVPTLNRNHVHDLPMAVPRPVTIQGFDSFVGPLLRRQRLNDVENIALARARDYLLPKLMSGEICLRDPERVREAVA